MKSRVPSARGIAALYVSTIAKAGNSEMLACIPDLVAGVDDPDDNTAYCFVTALTSLTLGDPALEPLWERLLARGRTEEIRAASASMLGWSARAGDFRGLAPLMKAVIDPSDQVLQQVAFALGHFQDQRAVLALVYLLGQRSEGAMGGACASLWKLEELAAPAIPALMQVIRARVPNSGWAPIALGRIGPAARDAVPLLISRLQDTTDPQRRARGRSECAIALGRIADDRPEAIAALRAGLDDPSIPVQRGSLEGLARLAWMPENDRSKIEFLANSQDGVFQLWARLILAQADGTLDAFVPELVGLTSGQEWWVSVAAIDALGFLGARAASALPALEPLCSKVPPEISTVDDQVRQAADPAVRRIKAAIASSASKGGERGNSEISTPRR
jgi:HEAT repeat protein